MQFTGRKLFLTDRHKLHGPHSDRTNCTDCKATQPVIRTLEQNREVFYILSVDNRMQFTGRKLFLTDRHKLHRPHSDRTNFTDRIATQPL